jgi:RNase P protein component
MSARIGRVPQGVDVVIRANTDVPSAPTSILAQDLDRLLGIVLRRLTPRNGR